jgi:hypothetical protein
MKKIPSLFKRDYEGTRLVYNEVVEGCEWVQAGEGVATEKIDGTSCLIQGGILYKRYDAKKGKQPPEGFIPAQPEPDPISGHWPGWLKVGDGPEDRWHREAFLLAQNYPDGTYELVGPKVQGNPYGAEEHVLFEHGAIKHSDAPVTFDELRKYLEWLPIEGLVWWRDPGDPNCDKCKIKRKDFGLPWPIKGDA